MKSQILRLEERVAPSRHHFWMHFSKFRGWSGDGEIHVTNTGSGNHQSVVATDGAAPVIVVNDGHNPQSVVVHGTSDAVVVTHDSGGQQSVVVAPGGSSTVVSNGNAGSQSVVIGGGNISLNLAASTLATIFECLRGM